MQLQGQISNWFAEPRQLAYIWAGKFIFYIVWPLDFFIRLMHNLTNKGHQDTWLIGNRLHDTQMREGNHNHLVSARPREANWICRNCCKLFLYLVRTVDMQDNNFGWLQILISDTSIKTQKVNPKSAPTDSQSYNQKPHPYKTCISSHSLLTEHRFINLDPHSFHL